MKVLFVADVHANEDAVAWLGEKGKRYDAIVIGGDLNKGPRMEFFQRFLEAAASTGKSVLFVHGNADPPGSPVPDGVVPLHERKAMLGRFVVGGLGGSNPTPFGTPFEMDDGTARAALARLGRVDILVSHCPPARTKCDLSKAGHIGSVPVREYVEKESPALVLAGHVHESRAVDNLGGTTVVNAGPLSEGKFAEVRLDGIISVELKAEDLRLHETKSG